MRKFLLFLVVIAIGLGVAQYFGWVKLPFGGGQVAQTAQRVFGGRRQQQKVDEPPVLTARARRLDVPVTLDAVGTVQALNTVVVRAQVDGKLIELNFTDGQDVRKGDILARIDPVTYQAQYDQAVGKKAQDEAQLANARIDLDRYDKLAVSNYGSKQQADTQRALVAQLDAQTRVKQRWSEKLHEWRKALNIYEKELNTSGGAGSVGGSDLPPRTGWWRPRCALVECCGSSL